MLMVWPQQSAGRENATVDMHRRTRKAHVPLPTGCNKAPKRQGLFAVHGRHTCYRLMSSAHSALFQYVRGTYVMIMVDSNGCNDDDQGCPCGSFSVCQQRRGNLKPPSTPPRRPSFTH